MSGASRSCATTHPNISDLRRKTKFRWDLYGEPGDIAQLVCFLARPLARYIAGTVIPVDGGLRRYQS